MDNTANLIDDSLNISATTDDRVRQVEEEKDALKREMTKLQSEI